MKFNRIVTHAFVAALTFPILNARDPDLSAQAGQESGHLVDQENGKEQKTEAVRYVPGEERSVLQTPSYRFVDPSGRKLELTGAVHIGEKQYYEGLNQHLKQFDAVLFEMVADPENVEKLRKAVPGAAKPGDEAPKEDALSQLYRVLAHDLLLLSLQKEEMDYRRANFVHADVSAKELNALLVERGLTIDGVFNEKLAKMGLNLEQFLAMLPTMKSLVPEGDPQALERMFAPLMVGLGSIGENDEDKAFTEILIDKRNERVMKVLEEQLVGNKRNLAVFYGSGHFKDLRRRLKERGWVEQGVEWRDAWIIQGKGPVQDAPAEVK